MLKLAALTVLAATAAVSANAANSPTLSASAPWWEKITVTMNGAGQAQSCRYESSIQKSDACDVESAPAAKAPASGSTEQFTRITFERRFAPGTGAPDTGKLHPGDTLLGGQIMTLAIDETGAVKGCRVVAASGDNRPDYGCEEARAEKFAASTGQAEKPSQGYMTILVYGHAENLA